MGRPKPTILEVITHIKAAKTVIVHGFGVPMGQSCIYVLGPHAREKRIMMSP